MTTRAEAGAAAPRPALALASAVVLSALSGWWCSRIFEPGVSPIPLVSVGPIAAGAAWFTNRRGPIVRVLFGATVAAGCTAGAVAAAGLPVATSVEGMADGLSQLAGARWPAPLIGAGMAVLAAIVAAGGFLTASCALRGRVAAAVLSPTATLGIVALVASDAGPPPAWSLALFVLAALGVARSAVAAPARSMVAAGYTTAFCLLLTGVPLLAEGMLRADRFDPQASLDTPQQPAFGISPLARLDEWRSRTPAEVMFTSSYRVPTAWRLVALTRYDGRSWLPANSYRPSSGVLDSSNDSTEAIAITVGRLDAAWIPAPAALTRVDSEGLADDTNSGFVPTPPLASGATYRAEVASGAVDRIDLATARAVTPTDPFIDGFELPASLLQLASTVVAGAQTDLQRAERIEAYLRDEFVLDPESPAGHSIAVEQLFLEQTRRGRDEQFVAAYALMASAVGLPVRVAVGFDASPNDEGTEALSSAATAWPEVEFVGQGWVRFEPFPLDDTPSPPGAGEGEVAPINEFDPPPPPSTVVNPVDSTLPDNSDATTTAVPDAAPARSAAITGASWAIGAFLTACALYVFVVLRLKRRRLRRWHAASDQRRRTVGAFASSVDLMIDLGADAPPSLTDRELVMSSAAVVGDDAADHLQPVGLRATAAVFSDEPIDAADADDSWDLARSFAQHADAHVGRRRALRARLSTRSLRRGLLRGKP